MRCAKCSGLYVSGVDDCPVCGNPYRQSSTRKAPVEGLAENQIGAGPPSTATRIKVNVPSPSTKSGSSWRSTKGRVRRQYVVPILIVVGVLGVGLSFGLLPRQETTELSPSTSVIDGSTSSVPTGADEARVSGVQVAKSVVQVVVSERGELCGAGSGSVVIDSRHVLTSYHVVESESRCRVDEIFVETIRAVDQPPVRAFRAEIVRFDATSDLALLVLTPIDESPPELIPVRVSGEVTLGDPLTAIGFPAIGGNTVTVTTGEVSGFVNSRGIRWIKSSVSISGGNSGGGAFNTAGELIGVPSFLGSADADETTDCRPVSDTNGDGRIDYRDQCVSVGGFINSLSPGSAAISLIGSR